ncbi:MAG: hypothetical protein IJV82_04185 [Oscillospiraceae bacterium]|nr:hypothetical protein [Oscillospiraceae bacterium]
MKKNKILVCFLLTAALLLSGCSQADGFLESGNNETNPATLCLASSYNEARSDISYAVMTCDFSDSISGVRLTREFDTRRGDVDEKDIPESKTVIIKGQQRKGTFCGTERYGLRSYNEFNYNSAQGKFRVDEDGNLTMCYWETSSNNGNKLTQEECLQIAKDFLSDRIDVDQYQLEVKYWEKFSKYEFTFRKYIGEFETMDLAQIVVLESGELSFFNSIMLDRIPSDLPIAFEQDKATAAVHAKLDALYAPVKDQYDSIEYELDPFQVTILENGETVLRCLVSIECKKNIGEFIWVDGDRLELIIRNEA